MKSRTRRYLGEVGNADLERTDGSDIVLSHLDGQLCRTHEGSCRNMRLTKTTLSGVNPVPQL